MNRASAELGVSSIALGSPDDLSAAAIGDLRRVELCGYGDTSMPQLQRFAASFGGRLGVHCPLPFTGWVKRFDISGESPDAQFDAFTLVEQTLRAARRLGASYGVVHFPTVTVERGLPQREGFARAVDAAARLVCMGRDAGVRILLENVGPNPYVAAGDDFARLFNEVERRTGTRPEMCCDPGHVHTLPGGDVEDFTRAIAPWVTSVHFYNTQRASQVVGWHAPALPHQSPEDGWMDWSRLFDILMDAAPVEQVILEHSAGAELDAVLAWAQSLLVQGGRRRDQASPFASSSEGSRRLRT